LRFVVSSATPLPTRTIFFDCEITPVLVPQKKGEPLDLASDVHPRATTLDALAKLKGVVKTDGTVTAGNASGERRQLCTAARQRGRCRETRPEVARARDRHGDCRRATPHHGIGPVPATRNVLALAKLGSGQLDVIELNEAFAAQALAGTRQLGLADDAAHVNPKGGAIAIGHPLGASGARLATTAINQLERTQGRNALCTMCIGVGQGIAIVIERV